LLEQFHSIGYVFNDLKPDNILVGTDTEGDPLKNLKLIDFGLSTPYLKKIKDIDKLSDQHIKCLKTNFKGNLAFSSFNAFNEISLSRRDDLISLIYVLIYLTSG